MLQAAAETGELAAVVSEGAGTRQFSEQMEEFHGLTRVIEAPGALLMTAGTALFSSTAPPPNLTDVAPKSQPLFVIWAPNGGNIEHMSKKYYGSRAAARSRSGRCRPPSTSAASATSRRSTSAASSAFSTAISSTGTSDPGGRPLRGLPLPSYSVRQVREPRKEKPRMAGLLHRRAVLTSADSHMRSRLSARRRRGRGWRR